MEEILHHPGVSKTQRTNLNWLAGFPNHQEYHPKWWWKMAMTPMVQSLKNHQKKNPSIGNITWGSPERIWVSSPSEFCFPRCWFQDVFKTPIFEIRTSKPQKIPPHNHRGGGNDTNTSCARWTPSVRFLPPGAMETKAEPRGDLRIRRCPAVSKRALVGSYCWWLKSDEKTTWDVENPVNNGINYQPQLVSWISEPSTVGILMSWVI